MELCWWSLVVVATGIEIDVCPICRGYGWTAGNWTESLPSPAPAVVQAGPPSLPRCERKLRPRGYGHPARRPIESDRTTGRELVSGPVQGNPATPRPEDMTVSTADPPQRSAGTRYDLPIHMRTRMNIVRQPHRPDLHNPQYAPRPTQNRAANLALRAVSDSTDRRQNPALGSTPKSS